MQPWLAIVRFGYPEGTSRDVQVEVDAETKQQARDVAAHMAQVMTHSTVVADYFEAVLMVRPKPRPRVMTWAK